MILEIVATVSLYHIIITFPDGSKMPYGEPVPTGSDPVPFEYKTDQECIGARVVLEAISNAYNYNLKFACKEIK